MRFSTLGLVVTLAFSLAAPLAAEAQQSGNMRRVGVLVPVSPVSPPSPTYEAFRQGLRALDYVEGQNIAREARSAEGGPDRLSVLASELVRLKVDVIVTNGEPAIRAAKAAPGTIPIVMAIVGDIQHVSAGGCRYRF